MKGVSKSVWIGPVALLLLLTGSEPAAGQAHRAIILGQVRDTTDAAVPGAEVRVIQKSTGIARSTFTNESGNYEVPGLQPGTYRVEASLTGFKTAIVDDIPITSAKRAEINLKLEIGQLSEQVTVRSEQSLLDSVSADVNTVLNERFLTELPIGQGNATFLFQMVTGADAAGGYGGWGLDVQPQQRAGTGLPRFNGSPSGTAEFTIDGAPNTQRGNAVPGGASAYNLTADMVQEMRVQTNTFDASIGHTGGTTIDLILKSGSKQYHGSGYGYFRQPDWAANSWAANRGGQPRPSTSSYQRWGFNAGGPVWLWPVYTAKEKLFFFYGYERWADLPPGAEAIGASVPRPQHLEGDFSDLLLLGSQYQLYDPLTARRLPNGRIERDPFPGNRIPANRIHPVAKTMQKFWPTPSQSGTVDGRQNLVYNLAPDPRKFWNSTLRIDYDLNPSHRLYGKFLYSKNPSAQWRLFTNDDVSIWRSEEKVPSLSVTDVWTVSPSFVADFRGSVMRHSQETIPHLGGLAWSDLKLGVEKYIDNNSLGFPSMPISGYDRLAHLPGSYVGFQNFAPGASISEIRSGAAHFSKLFHSHSFKFGADIRGYFYNVRRDDPLSVTFNGSMTRGPLDNSPLAPHGAALADFLLGMYSSSVITRSADPANYSGYQAFYFNDDWKITPKLTLSLGARYEREGPATERYNRNVSRFAVDVENPISPQVAANYALNPIPEIPISQFRVRGGLVFAGGSEPREAYDSDNNNLAPRLGVAYQLNSETVLRAGYGIYHIPYGQRFFATEFSVPGFDQNTVSVPSLDGGLTFSNSLENLFPNGVAEPVGAADGLRTFLGQGFNIPTALRNLPNAYNQRWLFSIQRRFGDDFKFEARYVGNKTIKMPVARDLNATPIQYLSTSPERDQTVIDRLTQNVPNPFLGVPGVMGALGTSTVISRAALLSSYSGFTNVSVQEPQGWSTYHALQLELERRMTGGLMFRTSYTWAKTMDALGFLNAGDPMPETVISANDRPHIWRLLGLWELPFGPGKPFGSSAGPVLGRIIGGWQIQGVSFIQSGVPVSWGNVLFRGDIKDIPVDELRPERMFNTAGFETAAAQQLALNVRTFSTRLAGVRLSTAPNTDLSLIKNVTIREGITFQFRAEAYNVWNQHAFTGNPNTTPTSTAFGTVTTSSPPRAVQLGAKLNF